MTTSLILIDLQNDYFDGGAMTLVGADAAVDNAARVLEQARVAGWPIFHVQHVAHRPDAGFMLPGTHGVELHPSVTPREGEALITKQFPNAFRDTTLHADLQAAGTDHVVIVGMMTHMCIAASTRAAFDLGYRCTVVADACATRALDFQGREIAAADIQGAHLASLGWLYATVVDHDALSDGNAA